MRPRTIGRALGIGIRVAGRIVGLRITAHAQQPGILQTPQPAPLAASGVQIQSAAQSAAHATTHAGQAVTRGVGGFLRPFRRVGGILWLEVTGVLFLLPAIVFAPTLWRDALAYSHTSDHRTLWDTAGVVAVFLYLGVSSFWRASRR